MKISEKCKVIAAGTIVAALMAGTALPALAISPAGDVPFAVLAQQNSAVTPEQVEALISQIGTVTRSRRADQPDRYCHAQQTRGNRGRFGCL